MCPKYQIKLESIIQTGEKNMCIANFLEFFVSQKEVSCQIFCKRAFAS
jgi:hypothetical protein